MSADSLLSGNSATRAGAARDGGQDLATFYQGINASRDVDPDLTALGHSYGATTAGYALTGDHTDTGVDRVAFFGSPGVNAFAADEVHVPQGQVYYAEAAFDPVADSNRFGLDPSNVPGVKHLDTRTSFDAHGNLLTGIGGITPHVHYLDDGSTSQYNLAAVVAGHPEAAIYGNVRLCEPPCASLPTRRSRAPLMGSSAAVTRRVRSRTPIGRWSATRPRRAARRPPG